MSSRRTRPTLLALSSLACIVGTLATASSGGAVISSDPVDLFDHPPESVECGETSALITFSVDTSRITDPGPGNTGIRVSSTVGDMKQSPGPFSDPGKGSVYWTVPLADLGPQVVTWSREDNATNAIISTGTFDVDLTGLCGDPADSTTTSTTSTTADPTATSLEAVSPSTTDAPVVDAAATPAASPAPVPVAAPATAIPAPAALTG